MTITRRTRFVRLAGIVAAVLAVGMTGSSAAFAAADTERDSVRLLRATDLPPALVEQPTATAVAVAACNAPPVQPGDSRVSSRSFSDPATALRVDSAVMRFANDKQASQFVAAVREAFECKNAALTTQSGSALSVRSVLDVEGLGDANRLYAFASPDNGTEAEVGFVRHGAAVALYRSEGPGATGIGAPCYLLRTTAKQSPQMASSSCAGSARLFPSSSLGEQPGS